MRLLSISATYRRRLLRMQAACLGIGTLLNAALHALLDGSGYYDFWGAAPSWAAVAVLAAPLFAFAQRLRWWHWPLIAVCEFVLMLLAASAATSVRVSIDASRKCAWEQERAAKEAARLALPLGQRCQMNDASDTRWLVFASPPRSPKNASYNVQLGAGSRIAIRGAFPDSRDTGARLLLTSPNGKETEVPPLPLALRRADDSLAIREMEFTPDVGGTWQVRAEGVQHGWHEVRITRTDKALPMRYGLETYSVSSSEGEKVPVCVHPIGMAASGATLIVNGEREVPLSDDGSGVYAAEIEPQPGYGMRFAFHAVIDGTQAQFFLPTRLRVWD
ncbi:MAG: hypothetical protein IJR28_03565 [Ottowia sp.]|nr:hypothetical protein [Ottowia sp.]